MASLRGDAPAQPADPQLSTSVRGLFVLDCMDLRGIESVARDEYRAGKLSFTRMVDRLP